MTCFQQSDVKTNCQTRFRNLNHCDCTLNGTPVGIIIEFLDQMTSANVLNYFRKGQLNSNVTLLLLISRDLMHKVTVRNATHFGKLSLAKVLNSV